MVMGALGGALMMKISPRGHLCARHAAAGRPGGHGPGPHLLLLLAVAAINFKADQTLVGTAMNLLGTAAATVFVKAMNTAENASNVSSTIQYIDAKKAFLVNIGGFEFNWFMVLAPGRPGPGLCDALQDPLRPAAGLRRASPGG